MQCAIFFPYKFVHDDYRKSRGLSTKCYQTVTYAKLNCLDRIGPTQAYSQFWRFLTCLLALNISLLVKICAGFCFRMNERSSRNTPQALSALFSIAVLPALEDDLNSQQNCTKSANRCATQMLPKDVCHVTRWNCKRSLADGLIMRKYVSRGDQHHRLRAGHKKHPERLHVVARTTPVSSLRTCQSIGSLDSKSTFLTVLILMHMCYRAECGTFTVRVRIPDVKSVSKSAPAKILKMRVYRLYKRTTSAKTAKGEEFSSSMHCQK